MYNPIPGGEEIEIYRGVIGHLPPPPPIETIKNYGLPEHEQKWSRTPLPDIRVRDIEVYSDEKYPFSATITWEEALREELIKQTGADPWDVDRRGDPKPVAGVDPNPNFIFPVMQAFREQEWDRCDPWDGGYWVFIKGKPVYLTPYHYFYCNWWKLDSGYPDWRWTDARRYYYWQWNFENENSFGMTEASKRGDGKTFRGTNILYLSTIFKKRVLSGIQSKTSDDAQEIFLTKLVQPYQELPEFLVPINDNPSNPQKSLKFFAPSKKGKNSYLHRVLQKRSLRSSIDFRNAKPKAYDGWSIRAVLFRDEEGKTEEIDVNSRHAVTKDCVYRDGKMVGKIYSATTVDVSDKGGKQYKKIWDGSDPYKLSELGETKSGLFRFFLPATETEYADEWGYPDIERAKREQSIKRKHLKSNHQLLQQYILNYPWNEEELFRTAGENCQYNLTILREREQITNDIDYDGYMVGDFEFTGEVGRSPVEFIEKENGKWNVSALPPVDQQNKVISRLMGGGIIAIPNNVNNFVGGFDPTKTHSNPDKRRSAAGGAILAKEDYFDENSPNFVADYVHQPDDPEVAYIDMAAACYFYGCQFLPENNLGIGSTLARAGMDLFIMRRPEETYMKNSFRKDDDPGIPANTQTNDLLLKNKKTWMKYNAHKLNLPRIIMNSIAFDPARRTMFDLEVATQLAITGARKEVDVREDAYDLSEMFTF